MSQAEAYKRWFDKDPERARRMGNERTKRWQKENPDFKVRARETHVQRLEAADRLKDNPCTDCGRSYPRYVMDWDHVKGEKVSCVAEMRNANAPVARILEEIAKCELVCSNCHRIRTHTRKDGNYSKSRVISGRKKAA